MNAPLLNMQVYDAALLSPDPTRRSKIVSSMGLDIPERELGHSDPLVVLRAIMGAWLPLAPTVLRAVTFALHDAPCHEEMRRMTAPSAMILPTLLICTIISYLRSLLSSESFLAPMGFH